MWAADVLAQVHDPAPPVAYSAWIWGVGLLLLALVAAWYIWVYRSTRPRAWEEKEGRGDRWSTLRESSLEEIAAAEGRFRSGAADLRTLHLDLNHIMREFANGRMRMDTSSLTVSELARLEGTDRLTSLLEDYQEPAFAADTDAEALAATSAARAVVREW